MLKNTKQRHLSREKLIRLARDMFEIPKHWEDSTVTKIVNCSYPGGWSSFTRRAQDGTL